MNPDAMTQRIPPATVASYPARSGNLLRALIDGEAAFTRICEAIEAAQRSVWATVAFMWRSFRMPGDRGAALDVLERASKRGIDVRLICWRPDAETESFKENAFWGSTEQMALLDRTAHGIRIRWDRAQPGFCQHQKTWLVDAGLPDAETCFVGGINLNPHSMVSPGHRGEGQNHDVYFELAGPSASDVHHNFVQRWNEASERDLLGGRWGADSEINLPFPARIPRPRGTALVQVQRTIHSSRYRDGHAAPGAAKFDIWAGERSNFETYCAAISNAQRFIYLEHQHISAPEIITRVREALQRGVEVVAVLPMEAEQPADFLALRAFETLTLIGLAGLGADDRRKPVWVHSKLMIVDGTWGTVGSCNLHPASLSAMRS